MTQRTWGFPITGNDVSDALTCNVRSDERWHVLHMDVPSGMASTNALDELRETLTGGPAEMVTADLCEALAGAPQVWVLDIRLASDAAVQLYIEDGEVFEVNLNRA